MLMATPPRSSRGLVENTPSTPLPQLQISFASPSATTPHVSSAAKNSSISVRTPATPVTPLRVLARGAASGMTPSAFPMLSSPSARIRGNQDLFTVMNAQRLALHREESECFSKMVAEFHSTLTDIAAYEAKWNTMMSKQRRAQETDLQRIARATERSLALLEKDTERAHRSAIVSLEEKCRAAVTHILLLELAVLQCRMQLSKLQDMERNRRRFLVTFEERERRELDQQFGGSHLWRPGMMCFGVCPLKDAATHCPFRGPSNRYGVTIDKTHFCSSSSSLKEQDCVLMEIIPR